MKKLLLITILLFPLAVYAQRYACSCGAHVTFLVSPRHVPAEGLPYNLSVEPNGVGGVLICFSCTRDFQENFRIDNLWMLVSDKASPPESNEEGISPLYVWAMGAQHGIRKEKFSIKKGEDHQSFIRTISVRTEEAARLMLNLQYSSPTGSKWYWIPIGAFLKTEKANQSLQPTTTAVIPAAEQPVRQP